MDTAHDPVGYPKAAADVAGTEEAAVPLTVDLKASRHVTEPSRYLLAVISASVVVGLLIFGFVAVYGRTGSLLAAAGLFIIFGLVWLLVQLRRISLLGEAVKVSNATTPELQRAIEEVRARLDYDKRTDVYVTERTNVPIHLQSLLGTRVMVVKGEFVADLMDEGRQAELVFLLATYFGALKSRYDRLNAVLTLLGLANVLRFVNPLLNPWYRATVYSGDQLAFLCCRDLRVSLAVAFRSLVGKEMAPRVRASGLVAQARGVRRSKILRLSQLMSPVPHPTNRYLNLLAFAGQEVETQYAAFLAELDPEVAAYLEEFRGRHRVTGGNWRLITVADVVGSALVAAGVVGGMLIAGQLELTAEPNAGGETTSSVPSTPQDNSSDEPTGGASSEEFTQFIASLPYTFADTCTDVTEQMRADVPASLRVAALCSPSAAESPAEVDLYAFSDPQDATAVFDQLMNGAKQGQCPDDAPAQRDWATDDGGAGRVGCGQSGDGVALVTWTDTGPGVVTVAWGRPQQTLDMVFAWWGELPALTT